MANEKSFQKLKVLAEEEKLKVWKLHDKQVRCIIVEVKFFI